MIVLTPTDRWLQSRLSECRRVFAVSSPFVSDYLGRAIAQLDAELDITLLTRTLLTDFASTASDLETVRAIAARAGGILSLSSLHAKVYVIDRKAALITSANATRGGMYRNRACGFATSRQSEVVALRHLIASGFGSRPLPELWTTEDLDALREPVEALRSAIPRVALAVPAAVEAPPRIRLQRRQYGRLIDSFSGWLQLTIEGISRIPSDTFAMDDVFAACAPLAAPQYPNNRNVRPKLRQQMQRLRDLGLVLFLGDGRYELLAKPRT